MNVDHLAPQELSKKPPTDTGHLLKLSKQVQSVAERNRNVTKSESSQNGHRESEEQSSKDTKEWSSSSQAYENIESQFDEKDSNVNKNIDYSNEDAQLRDSNNVFPSSGSLLATATIIKTPLTKTLLKKQLANSSDSSNGDNSSVCGTTNHLCCSYNSNLNNDECNVDCDNGAFDFHSTNTGNVNEQDQQQQQQQNELCDDVDFKPNNDLNTTLAPTTTTTDTAITKCSKCNNNNNIHYNNFNCYYRKKPRTPICRIMTLSRGPYSELDKMSLFQDLKLKRRKIDSRCSSDGESAADTSTSSPDLLAPMSPKIYDNGPTSTLPIVPPAATSVSSTFTSAKPENVIKTKESSITAKIETNHAKCTALENKNEDVKKEETKTEQLPSPKYSLSSTIASSTTISTMPISPWSQRTSSPREIEGGAGEDDNATGNGSKNSNIKSVSSQMIISISKDTDHGRKACNASNGDSNYRSCSSTKTTISNDRVSSNGVHVDDRIETSGNSESANAKGISGNNESETPSNLSVIRSVKEERILSSPTRMHSHNQQEQNCQQNQAKGVSQSQQHVTVLVTPQRIKVETSQQQPQRSSPAIESCSLPFTTTAAPLKAQSSTSLALPTPSPSVQSYHLHQQLTTPRKNSPTSGLQLQQQQQQHLLNQSMHHFTQQQQLQLLQQAAAISRPTQMSPNTTPSSPRMLAQSSQSPHHMLQQHVRIKKEPTNYSKAVSSGNNSMELHLSPSQQQQQSPQQIPSPSLCNVNQNLMHPSSLQSLRQPNRDAAIFLRVKNEVQQQVAAVAVAGLSAGLMQSGSAAAVAAQRMVWVSNARINGVKPEAIGGSLGNLRPNSVPVQSSSPHPSSSSSSSQLSPPSSSQTPPRGTPTVIMGESCGVRTMIWGYEPPAAALNQAPGYSGSHKSSSPQHHQHQQQQQQQQQQQSAHLQLQQHHSSQSSFQSNSSIDPSIGSRTPTHASNSPQNNEEAAQLLLSLGQTRIQDIRSRPHHFRTPHALNMERLWAGDYSQLPPSQIQALNLSAQQQWSNSNSAALNRSIDAHDPTDEDDQPLVCMICEDKATGLHYGIITCEGCKGFFKRTVQNRRVYTCVADGTCEITKAQRNRCQYCRFKKCIEQGMVLQAVREDRMPGGRNSGAVYNLYKVKYKKHKKSGQKHQQNQHQQQQMQSSHQPQHPHLHGQLSPHSASHLFSPQQHMHQQQNVSTGGMQQRQSKLLTAPHGLNPGLSPNEIKPIYLGSTLKSDHMHQSQASQQQQQMHSPHQQTIQQQQQQQIHLSPHQSLQNSPHSVSKGALQNSPSHLQQFSSASLTQPLQRHHGQQHQVPTHLQQQHSHNQIQETPIKLPSHLVNGTILKTALTNPSEIVHLRHRLDSTVSSSKDRQISYEHALGMIQILIDCDAMEDIATLPHFSEFLEDKSEISEKLCNIGDSIVHKLVSWTKKLPFYLEIPVEIHTKLLTDKWHEILILTTAAYQALHGKSTFASSSGPSISERKETSAQADSRAQSPIMSSSPASNQHIHQLHSHNLDQSSPHLHSMSSSHQQLDIQPTPLHKDDPEFVAEVNAHLSTLQTCLTTLMGQPIGMEQLKLDVGHMVDKMTQITIMFRRIKLKMEEYVCLKVYILLNKEVELESIQERYVQVLRTYLQHSMPQGSLARLNELLSHIPEIQAAASLLLESKMFYVPFVLNSASIR